MSYKLTEQDLYTIIDEPILLGHLIGKDLLSEIHNHFIKFIWYPEEYFLENDNWKKTMDFFNSLGQTYDIENSDGEIERIYLTEEIFKKLIKSKHRSIQAHRGSYKSTSIVLIGIILRFIFKPNDRIAIIRKNVSMSQEIVNNVSAVMKREDIQELFKFAHGFYPKAQTDRQNKLKFNFKTTVTPEGNLDAYGVHTSIVGMHYDFILLDDFITIDDKISRAEREKTKIRLEEIANNVLDPGKHAGYVGTPWHKEDAWCLCPSSIKVDVYSAGIFDSELIQEKRSKTTNVTFAANYELKHASHENALFKEPKFDKWLFYIKTGVGFLDKKYSGKDTNALAFFAKKENGRYQGIGWVFDENIKTKLKWVKEKWLQYKIGTIYMENNDDKGFTADILNDMGVKADTYHEDLNKHVKIQSYGLENGFWEMIDWDPETDPRYLSQVLDYVEGSEPDDAPDTLGNAGRKLVGSGSESVFVNRWKNV